MTKCMDIVKTIIFLNVFTYLLKVVKVFLRLVFEVGALSCKWKSQCRARSFISSLPEGVSEAVIDSLIYLRT